MRNDNEDTMVQVGPVKLNRTGAGILSLLLAGTGGIFGFSTQVSDRFTGSDWAQQKSEINRRFETILDTQARAFRELSALRIRVGQLEDYKERHSAESSKGFSQIGALERELRRLENTVDRLIDRTGR